MQAKNNKKNVVQTQEQLPLGPQEKPRSMVEIRREISAFKNEITERVRANWLKPSGLEGEANIQVTVRVRVSLDGRLAAPQISRSSGNRYFDDSVIRAIHKTHSLPMPPRECRDCWQLNITFRPNDE